MRVPTYTSQINMMNYTLNNKAQLDLHSFQALTGLKASTYSGYGMQAYNIVALESSLGVTSNFMQNNEITNTELKAMNTALDSVYKSTSKIKTMLTGFNSGLESITPDYTGGKIEFNNDTIADYMGKTITIDGIQYTFTNNATGNNIDISAAADGEDVMDALFAKIPTNSSIVQNGRELTFPLYTVNGASSVLNVTGVTTGEPHTMSQDQVTSMRELQNYAFSTLLMLTDSLNITTSGRYLFGGGDVYEPPVNFPFRNIDEFQSYYDGVNIKFPSSAAANLSNYSVDANATGDLTLELDSATGNTGTIQAANAGGFLKESVVANPSTTGTLTFNQDTNSLRATQYGAFNNYKAGDTMVIGGNVDPANAKTYIIKEVSADGKTVKFEESTPIINDETVVPNNDVTFSTSYPVGAVINMQGFGSNVSGRVQVTGVSPDGQTLYITTDPNQFPANGSPLTVPASSNWSMKTQSYYQGGDLSTEKRISENQTILMDANGGDAAFEKLFRALGEIAQGNLVDTRNPADDISGLIDPGSTSDKINDALDNLYAAVYNGGRSSDQKNSDLYSIMAKMSSNQIVVNTAIENQTLVQKNLSDNIYSMKNVDQTEASTKALLAATNLDASYSILKQAMSLSLLNYLK